jgi:hypothetical protein
MSINYNPKITTNALVLLLDASNQKFRHNAYAYKWYTTTTSVPNTKEGFDALFTGTASGIGAAYGEVINWTTVAARPVYITPSSAFSWEVNAYLKITEPGNYIFNTSSDDGNELQINDNIVTSFYGGRGITEGENSAPINLAAGYHKFLYRMQQGAGGAAARVRWQTPGSSELVVIPSTAFSIRTENGVWVDQSQNQNDMYIQNAVLFDGSSLEFDGLGSNAGRAVPASLQLRGDKTIEIWVKPNKALSESNSAIIRTGLGVDLIYAISYDPINNRVIFQWYQDAFKGLAAPFNSFVDSQWHQLVFVSSGINGTWYINGSEMITNATITTPTATSASNMGIGATRFNAISGTTVQDFAGEIGQIMIYNRSLMLDEIQQNFNAFRGRYGI